MRLRWFKNLQPTIQLTILAAAVLIFIVVYIPLSKYIKPAITSLLLPPLKLCQGISSNARDLVSFYDLLKENKKLKITVDKLTAQSVQWQELALENQRLRKLLSLPQSKSLTTAAALVVGKDSSNWTKTALINKGKIDGIQKDMPVVLGANLVGKVSDVAANSSKVTLLLDFNSKTPAKVLRTREEGIVFGIVQAGQSLCRIKYIQGDIQIGDQIISSGLGEIYPKGLLIGEVISVEEEQEKLYKTAEIRPVVDFSTLEELMVITGHEN